MQISVFYDHITQAWQQTGRSLMQLLEACKSWGIDGLEINYTQLRRGGLALRRSFRRAGMAISCIYEFYDFTHDGDLRQAKKHVELAAKAGADRVLIVPGFLEEQEAKELEACCCGRRPGRRTGEPDADLPKHGSQKAEHNRTGQRAGEADADFTEHESRKAEHGGRGRETERGICSPEFEAVSRYMESHFSTCQVRDALRELVVYGQQKGVRITLEDFDGYTSPCARMLPLKWLMEQVPGLGYTLDMGNFAYSDEDVTEAYELLKEYIVHVHCKDRGIEEKRRMRCSHCQGLACVPTGGGYLPVRELVLQLKSRGYDGYLVIEHFDAPDQTDYIRRSAEFLRALIGEENTIE